MTLPIERARTRRPITWLTLIGVILLPVLVGGMLVLALYNPTDRLDRMSAAIVNDDAPVTLNGQLVPLGRQLTAGLVKGSPEAASNLDWTISNPSDAAAGLASGRYSAVITIPKDFSAAATSTKDGATARQATIDVRTAPDARVVDDAITATIAQTAASVFGQELSKAYLKNVLLGFSTLGTKLGDAAAGAAQLQSGAQRLADGASTWAAGATGAAHGLDQWAAGAHSTAAGVGSIAANLAPIGNALAQSPQVPQQALDAADALAANSAQLTTQVTDAAAQLDRLAADCSAQGGSAQLCQAMAQAAATTHAALPQVVALLGQTPQLAQGLHGISQLPALGRGLQSMAAGLNQAHTGIVQLAGGAQNAAAGVHQLADGATGIASGASGLATGAGGLADGLRTAAGAIPSYTDAQAAHLAAVVADPMKTSGIGSNLFGASAIPLLAMLALWFGSLASFIALRAASARALVSRRSSLLLALRGLAPAAVIGAVQGVLVAGVVQLAASYDWGAWWVFAAISALAGVAFAAVNQALVAVFGGAGRWISALVGVLAVAAGVVSTVPGVLAQAAAVLPTDPAYRGMLAALTATPGIAAAAAGLVVWTVLGLLATTVAVARRRTTSAASLLKAAPVGT